jgi:hypothetical protein
MQITINAPDTLPQERLYELIKEIEIKLAKEAELFKNQPNNIAWELGKNLFDKHSSRQGNLSKDRKKIIREKLYAKHRIN